MHVLCRFGIFSLNVIMPNLTFVKQKQKQSLPLTSNFSDIDKIASGMHANIKLQNVTLLSQNAIHSPFKN